MPRWVATATTSCCQAPSAAPSISHAPWGIDAVLGVHPMYGVGRLGTARATTTDEFHPDERSNTAVGLTHALGIRSKGRKR